MLGNWDTVAYHVILNSKQKNKLCKYLYYAELMIFFYNLFIFWEKLYN